jgi:hypothetical protein
MHLRRRRRKRVRLPVKLAVLSSKSAWMDGTTARLG